MTDIREEIRDAIASAINDQRDVDRATDAVMARLDIQRHYAIFGETGWFMEHPIACRLSGLSRCEFHHAVEQDMARPDALPMRGRFQVILGGQYPQYTLIEGECTD